MGGGGTVGRIIFMKYRCFAALILPVFFVPGPAVAQTALSQLPGFAAAAPLIPAPPARGDSPCSVLPEALAAASAAPYDAQVTACFDGLLAAPGYVSPEGSAAGGKLTKAEDEAIFKYVDSYAYLVNSALRKGEGVEAYAGYIKLLNSALDKLPVYGGVTFRGSAYPPVVLEKLIPGAVFTDPAFLSTTRDPAVADGYAGAKGYISVILSRTGRSISYSASLQGLEKEMEVLFKSSSRMRVIAVSPRADGRTVVYLEQLS